MTVSFASIKQSLPYLGVGIGLRRDLAEEIFAHAEEIDWLEFVPENYMGVGGRSRQLLDEAGRRFPLVSHGVGLSLGSTDPLDNRYLDQLKDLVTGVSSPWWSDHLCFSSAEGIQLHDLLPLPFSREAIDHTVGRIEAVRKHVGLPFLIENISYYMKMPGCEMSEAEFLSSVLEESDCGLLLDINNVYVNSVNHQFDPYEYLDSIPLERTVQIHVAGHKQGKRLIIDTHGAAVIDAVYNLLDYALARCDARAVMLERDQNFPEFDELLKEIKVIASIVSKYAPGTAGNQSRRASCQTMKEVRHGRAVSA